MRKIDDRQLMEWIESGVSQKECAERFGVSPSAINQRIVRIKKFSLPESVSKLTPKQQRFVLEKASGATNVAAARAAYDTTSDSSAKVIGSSMMRDNDIAVAIADLMAQEGIPRRRRVQRLKDLIESPDLSIAGKGLDMSFKLGSEYQPTQVNNDVSIIIAMIRQIKNSEDDFIDVKQGN